MTSSLIHKCTCDKLIINVISLLYWIALLSLSASQPYYLLDCLPSCLPTCILSTERTITKGPTERETEMATYVYGKKNKGIGIQDVRYKIVKKYSQIPSAMQEDKSV